MADGPTRVRPPLRVAVYAKARIAVTRGPDRGIVVDAVSRPVRIGTDPGNDIVLTDDSVSRHHCELEVGPEGVRVRDRGSTNGVLVGGVRVYDALLPQQATLQIGETEVNIAPLGEVVEREQADVERFGDLVGKSPRIRELFADLDRIAHSDVTVLIEGETGTGKDLVAESIHRASARAAEPFVVFDCSAVSPSLVESELFGHARGAFTGAVQSHAGVFERAHGGTLFLDEIGELPKELQPKLLRALEKREVRRVGGSTVITVDVRVLAATNRNLRAEIRAGRFRQDLYFRLAGAFVVVPPLRDRMEDLPLLVAHFLTLERARVSPDDLPAHVWRLFSSYRWPGNVRELRNAVSRLLVMPDRPLGPSVAPAEADATSDGSVGPLRTARREAMDEFERRYLAAVLGATQGNVSRAANLAEVSRQMMQKLMRKHGHREPDG